MRFLKNKVNLKQDSEEEKTSVFSAFEAKQDLNQENTLESSQKLASANIQETFILQKRKPRQKPTNPLGGSKNIVKNYGKALCSFASSDIGVPYIENTILKNGCYSIQINEFMDYFKSKKEEVNNIESLRKLLVEDEEDTEEIRAYKTIFKKLSIIFLKYFSVNWIFGGRLKHKKTHLDFRFKMLRRIQNPENFTYLKNFSK